MGHPPRFERSRGQGILHNGTPPGFETSRRQGIFGNGSPPGLETSPRQDILHNGPPPIILHLFMYSYKIFCKIFYIYL